MITPLDDIVFEGRNRSYGAYDLRKRYKSLMTWSVISGSVFVILIFTGIQLYYITAARPRVTVGEILAAYEMMDLGTDYELLPPPDVPLQKPAEETIVPEVNVEEKPLVVDEKVDEKPEEKDRPDIKDTTAKTGDQLQLKGSGPGSDSGMVYIRVERLPEYPGGKPALDRFLRDNIKYPQQALSKKLSGVVHISFVINQFGRVERVKVARSVDPLLDNEAMRVVKMMPVWVPGRRHGQPVKVLLTLPIRFMPNA